MRDRRNMSLSLKDAFLEFHHTTAMLPIHSKCVFISLPPFPFRTMPWSTGETTAPRWRSWGWVLLLMVVLSVWHHQAMVLEPQLVALHQPDHSHVKLASGPTMRWNQHNEKLTYWRGVKQWNETQWHLFYLAFQICTFLKGTTIQWIEDQKVPYAAKNNEWVGFDTRESYETKVGGASLHCRYVTEKLESQ